MNKYDRFLFLNMFILTMCIFNITICIWIQRVSDYLRGVLSVPKMSLFSIAMYLILVYLILTIKFEAKQAYMIKSVCLWLDIQIFSLALGEFGYYDDENFCLL